MSSICRLRKVAAQICLMFTKPAALKWGLYAMVMSVHLLCICRQRVVVGHWPTDVPAAAGGQHVAAAMQGHPDSRYPGCFFPHEMPPSPVKLTTVVWELAHVVHKCILLITLCISTPQIPLSLMFCCLSVDAISTTTMICHESSFLWSICPICSAHFLVNGT